MKYIKLCIVLLIFTLTSCNTDSTNPLQTMKYFEGTWAGVIDTDSLMITFIEGEFEGSVTLSGSGFISNDSNAFSYIVMNGTHDRKGHIIFALYRYPVEGKEEFHLEGTLIHNKIDGIFSKYDRTGNIIKTGNWSVKIWYD